MSGGLASFPESDSFFARPLYLLDFCVSTPEAADLFLGHSGLSGRTSKKTSLCVRFFPQLSGGKISFAVWLEFELVMVVIYLFVISFTNKVEVLQL